MRGVETMDRVDKVIERIQKGFEYCEIDSVGVYQIPAFAATGKVKHAFTTRLGGISHGPYASLNLSWNRYDDRNETVKNHAILAEVLGTDVQKLVCPMQIHSSCVAVICEEDAGRGYLSDDPTLEVDAVVTDVAGIPLSTVHADCTPLFFLDEAHHAIGLAHAGWKGTVGKIAQKTIETMTQAYGTRAEDCLCGIGPAIGPCCFEVDVPVMEQFREKFADLDCIAPGEKDGKWMIDLLKCNMALLLDAGVQPQNITLAGLCTSCHTDRFYSYRKEHGNTGAMASILQWVKL